MSLFFRKSKDKTAIQKLHTETPAEQHQAEILSQRASNHASASQRIRNRS